jgi:CysZ protein
MSVGVQAFLDGLSAVRRPGVKRYLILPAAISLLFVGGGLFLAFGYLANAATWVADMLPGWLDWLNIILAPVLYVSGFLAGVWLLGFMAVIVAGPFMGQLSASVELAELGTQPVDATPLTTLIGSTIKREAQKLLYILPRLLGLLLLSFIPVINLLSPALWLLFGAWSMALQFTDYPGENRNLKLVETFNRLRANRSAALGFGACVTLAMGIPLVNFLVIPVAVAGGTLLWHRIEPR